MSMWRLLTALVTLAVLLVAAAARHSGLVAVAAQQVYEDATSVPSLIEALAKHGTVPREGPYSAIDTRFHVLATLQAITNHDAGRNAEDWRQWYEKNKDKTQGQ